MKKILFYFPTKGMGGTEREVSVFSEYFCNRGMDVLVVNDMDLNLPFYPMHEKVRTAVLDDTRSNAIVRNIRRHFRLRAIIKKEKPDAVVAFMRLTNFRMLLASAGIRVKKFVCVCANPRAVYRTAIGKWLGNLFYGSAYGTVFQTYEQRSFFSQKVQKNSRVILNPVNDVFYNTPAQYDEKTVLMVGRIDKNKRHELAIRAFARVCREYTDYTLKIYGDGPEKANLTALVESLGLSERIVFCGTDNHIENVYAHAQIFMLTSYSEGLPNVLMEAMTMGLPVISTDCAGGGARVLIENETQGIIVARDNEEELVQALRRLLGDATLGKTLGENAKKRAEAFRAEMICRQWEEYIL